MLPSTRHRGNRVPGDNFRAVLDGNVRQPLTLCVKILMTATLRALLTAWRRAMDVEPIAIGRGSAVIGVMRIAFVSCALIGCAYKPGSFAAQNEFSGQRATIACLDVSIERRADLPIGPVIGYQFANRCDHPTTVDLGSIAVIGRSAAGDDLALRPYDPRTELHPVTLDARNVGAESLAYPADRALSQVCVDVATFAHQGGSQWLCFGGAASAQGTIVGAVP
jgi:hypothetical protein